MAAAPLVLLLGTHEARGPAAPRPAALTVTVSVPDTFAAAGARVELPLTVDLTESGDALGSFEGSVRFASPSLTFVSAAGGDFTGVVEINDDDGAAGVVLFAGASADASVNRGVVTLLVLTVDVSGAGGEVAAVAPEATELVAAGSFADLTGMLEVDPGQVVVDPGPLALEPVPATWNGVPGQTARIDMRLDLSQSAAQPAAFTATLGFDPTVARVDSVKPGDFGGSLETNLDIQADSGLVRWALIGTDSITAESVVLASFYLTAVGERLTSTALVSTVSEAVNGSNFASLLPFLGAVPDGEFEIFDGVWGDASLSWQDAPNDPAVTAFDALVCLSAIVGRDIGANDAARCDVAPDAGTEYDGTVTSLDALAILAFVVGGDTAGFRVGELR